LEWQKNFEKQIQNGALYENMLPKQGFLRQKTKSMEKQLLQNSKNQ
jgi:hypothetical protein